MSDDDLQALSDAATRGDKFALARLVSVFEDSRPDVAAKRQAILARLDAGETTRGGATFIGITGTPGAGKSTLVGELAKRLIQNDTTRTVAVLAVDPTSHISGGSLLGDRTRVHFPADEPRLYFRSQPSRLDLGGLGRGTFQVCRLLDRLFDLVFVETVGIGQSEIDIRYLVDRTYLVLQPLGGDQIQFMKAGIMEIPDAFIINKCDEENQARQSYYALQASLSLARPDGPDKSPPVFRTSAHTGRGLDKLTADIEAVTGNVPTQLVTREGYFFRKWVRDEYGAHGLRFLESRPAGLYHHPATSFDTGQLNFSSDYLDSLNADRI